MTFFDKVQNLWQEILEEAEVMGEESPLARRWCLLDIKEELEKNADEDEAEAS